MRWCVIVLAAVASGPAAPPASAGPCVVADGCGPPEVLGGPLLPPRPTLYLTAGCEAWNLDDLEVRVDGRVSPVSIAVVPGDGWVQRAVTVEAGRGAVEVRIGGDLRYRGRIVLGFAPDAWVGGVEPVAEGAAARYHARVAGRGVAYWSRGAWDVDPDACDGRVALPAGTRSPVLEAHLTDGRVVRVPVTLPWVPAGRAAGLDRGAMVVAACGLGVVAGLAATRARHRRRRRSRAAVP